MNYRRALPVTTPTTAAFKLERIKLPQFSGKWCEWQSFHDLFQTSVDKNPNLSGAEKLVHLKSYLTGEAATIVSAFQPTDANYIEAWASLQKRYADKREIIFAHLKKFDDLKSMQNESSSGLRNLADTINECIRSLKVLNVPVTQWDLILIYYSTQKLDSETKKQWSLVRKSSLPTMGEFLEFLESRALALGDSKIKGSSNLQPEKKKFTQSHYTAKQGGHSNAKSAPQFSCIICSESHRLFGCPVFNNMTTTERRSVVKEKSLCFNCLSKGHNCAQCTSKYSCKSCGGRHNSLLHIEQKSTSSATVEPTTNPEPSVSSSHATPVVSANHVVLMGTLLANAEDFIGEMKTVRIFVDPGSEAHFISESCVNMLGLQRKKSCKSVTGIGGCRGGSTKGAVNVCLYSRTNNHSMNLSALILPKLTGHLPRIACQNSWAHLKGLELADPMFHQPGKIDILLGAKAAATILLPGILHGPPNTPVAQNTVFGWMLSGQVSTQTGSSNQISSLYSSISCSHASCTDMDECVQPTLSKFWTLEEPDHPELALTTDEEECEQHFQSTHSRDTDGRYIVRLPFKKSAETLGNSVDLALQRFNGIEKRLSKQTSLRDPYVQAMRESIAAGHLELVPPQDFKKNSSQVYYMPHHVVIKETSQTTKYRVVFDASAKTSNGISLNDILHGGPKLQIDLMNIIIRFRTHIVAMSSDIAKFYPQVKVHSYDADFQRIVWRENSSEPLLHYRFVRVTFCVTCAPYLAIRSLHQLADDEGQQFPHVSSVLKEDFLVDNLLSGATDDTSALELQNQLKQILQRGGFRLRQWMSNSQTVLNAVQVGERDENQILTIDEDNSVKTIGLLWHPNTDTFGVKIVIPKTEEATKRKVLSSIARIFDPLGWLSPVTVRVKILLQQMWKLNLDWDSPLPAELHHQWPEYCKDLSTLEHFRIPRCLAMKTSKLFELHGFSDASNQAYAACVYIRTIDEFGTTKINLVAGKSKVSPVKTETIPRLELCAAVLLTKLMSTVLTATRLEFSVIKCWTDSTIVLDWLKTSSKLPVFVVNRIRKIQADFPHHVWNHVIGTENPADCASRGISAAKFITHTLWLQGPEWLSRMPFELSTHSMFAATNTEDRLKDFIKNFSSYTKMIRVVGYCLRFIKNSRLNKNSRIHESLNTVELNQALHCIVRNIQLEIFKEEIKKCNQQEEFKAPMKFLTPFIDKDGILRVGGRLQQSTIPYGEKHPILLPKSHNFTMQMVRNFHLTYLHCGPQLLLAIIREQFWIIRAKDVVKKIIRQCVICHRQNPKTQTQLMGQLPMSRITTARPFSRCGVDYAGPFKLCLRAGRHPISIKAYVSLFICMVTKAIHLEWVSDQSTPAFIAALTRFISRRGMPTDIYCDGGSNFEGAKNEMDQIVRFLQSKQHIDAVSQHLAIKGIHCNPAYAPHHGGLWEAGVKSMKFHLRRIIEDRHLTIEEFTTLLS